MGCYGTTYETMGCLLAFQWLYNGLSDDVLWTVCSVVPWAIAVYVTVAHDISHDAMPYQTIQWDTTGDRSRDTRDIPHHMLHEMVPWVIRWGIE